MADKKILIAESDTLHIFQLKQEFSKYNSLYEVCFCQHKDELWKSIENENFDLLIVSLHAEDNSGMEILSHSLVFNLIPVVFLCEYSDRFMGVELIKKGAVDYIPKTEDNLQNLPFSAGRALREWENITARRQAEARLLETESKYRIITESINDVVWEIDVRTQKFTFISGSVYSFLGYSEYELEDMDIFSLIHPESFVTLDDRKNEIADDLYNKGKEPGEIKFNHDLKFYHKDGTTRWGEVRGFLVWDKEKKQVVAISGTVRNITAHRKTERELEIREAFFETLIREAPLGIVILDNADRVKQVNKHFLNLFGYSEQECLEQFINDLIVPEDLKDESKALTGMAARGEYIDHETIRCSKAGQRIDVHVMGKPVMLNDHKLGVFGIYQDITQRKKVEVASKVAKIKQQFLANMSHEIRSPMTGIMGMIELLSKTSLDKQQHFYVEVIRKSSDGLLAIVNDILDLSKIEAGKMIIRPRDFNLKRSAETLFSLFNALARKKDIGFILEYDETLPEYVFADENRISQIVTNLLSNAAKFTSEGFVRLNYKYLGMENHKHMIRISVKDTGIGIEEADKEKLFKIFSQLDSSDTRNYEGAGLGLSISHKLAELMDGRIEVESTPGRGSCFSLILGVDESHDVASFHQHQHAQLQEKDITGTNVLLTEDKRTNQMVISLMLKELGCNVVLASNGAEAIEKLNEGDFDIIFMDIQMPVMDGLTAVKIMRSENKGKPLPAIIGLSAKAMEGDAEYHIAEGMDDYIFKPVSSDVLRNCIMKWIKR
jgi:PAS domain S-box-containing protein